MIELRIMRIWEIKILLLLLLTGFAITSSQAQLLQDINKLKTEKVKGDGFRPFKKLAPLFKKKSKIKGATKTTRYTQVLAGAGDGKSSNPKFSKKRSTAGTRTSKAKFTRVIAGKGGGGTKPVRYTKKNTENISHKKVNTRFTKVIAGQGGGGFTTIKFTKEIAGQGNYKISNPRFTRDIAGQGGGLYNVIRYSQDNAGQGNYKTSNPRFTRDIAGQGGALYNVIRYTQERAGAGNYKVRKPRSISDRSMVFSYPKLAHFNNRHKSFVMEYWQPPKAAKRSKKEGRDFHPSTAYLNAKYVKSKLVRDGLQKFNILLVRVHGNKTQPRGVHKKSKKLKFDKDETIIWNNKEREYTHN